jgi:AraC family transcriptional regulator
MSSFASRHTLRSRAVNDELTCPPGLSVGGLDAREVTFAANERLPRHVHDVARICLVLRGEFCELTDNSHQRATPGTTYFLPAGAAHANHFGSDGARCLRIEMVPAALEGLQVTSADAEHPWFVSGGMQTWRILRFWSHLCSGDANPASLEELVIGCIPGTRASPQAARGRMPRWLRRARDQILASLDDPPRLGQLAAESNLHPVYFARVFRAHVGSSVGEYIQAARVARAAELLLTGTDTIGAVAATLGYADQAHFTRHFTRRLGVSPGAYRGTAR